MLDSLSCAFTSIFFLNNKTIKKEMNHLFLLFIFRYVFIFRYLLFLDTCCLFLDTQSNFHMVVDCANIAMKEHCYWPIVSDLINLLSHKTITTKFLSDTRLVTMWLDLLSYLQGMNLNNRELSQHVEFESETYYAAFSAELEMASSPMWSLISHCKTKVSKTCVALDVLDL